ncbi:hypothetical protein BU14_0014s0111 [Porphyra umbilicalis]|uniref:Uncharacterized protein n=1 Tax=Porphyra umbilicalis TaxID=2786 RepID=A0A1X6PL76_PORUM|nr:hypothetical protein BU14_0014s0111 [Porphyra umbilicalis]|eukprot:OSX81562.1 hypothetical protein BU14_0014s0111 [Porphyra umbilicalis]
MAGGAKTPTANSVRQRRGRKANASASASQATSSESSAATPAAGVTSSKAAAAAVSSAAATAAASTATPKAAAAPAKRGGARGSGAPPLVTDLFSLAGITWADTAITVLLAVAAGVLRVSRLSSPNAVVYDEYHYGKFLNWTLTHRFFFDVNPPLSKLVLSGIAYLAGYDPTAFEYGNIGEEYPTAAMAWAARLPSAIFGTLAVPLLYRVCRQLRLSRAASTLGASFGLFDTLSVVQSRLIMPEALLVFLCEASFYCALVFWDAKRVAAARKKAGTLRALDVAHVVIYMGLTATWAGLALATRWTSFATPVLILAVSAFGVPPFLPAPVSVWELLSLFVVLVVAYFVSFGAFFEVVPLSGEGNAFMSADFQQCLTSATAAADAATSRVVSLEEAPANASCSLSTWAKFVELNRLISQYSKGVRGDASNGSPWYQWLVNYRGTLYYRTTSPAGEVPATAGIIYALMNPAMIVIVDLLLLAFVAVLFYAVRYRYCRATPVWVNDGLRRASVLFLGWAGSMLPTMIFYRYGQLYQFLPGLFFAQATAAVVFDIMPVRSVKALAAAVGVAGMAAAYAYWAPWVYALPLSQEQHDARQWLPLWK